MSQKQPNIEELKKAAFAKAFGGEIIKVQVELFSPFYKFMKEYLNFFGSKYTIEDLCRMMIYENIEHLYRELESFINGPMIHLKGYDFYNKHPHIAATSYVDPEGGET